MDVIKLYNSDIDIQPSVMLHHFLRYLGFYIEEAVEKQRTKLLEEKVNPDFPRRMSNIESILAEYYENHDTKDFASLFEAYMEEIGARKLDCRQKDTSNTYRIDGDSANWNRVECYYYKNSGDYQRYEKFAFCITFRKRAGDYFLIEVGSENEGIKRPYEISFGKIVRYDEKLLMKLVKEHPKLFAMMCDKGV